MASTVTTTAPIEDRPATWLSRVLAGFTRPPLPPTSRRAFRFHMAYTLLDAVFAGTMGNSALMAVKALNASDVQLQLPQAMASIGLFAAVFSGAAMAARRKKPFVLVPGIIGAIFALLMPWMPSAQWFLLISGVISICDFGMRPAVPSILRTVYPDHCRSHIAGTMRQWSSIVFLGTTLLSGALLSASANVRGMIQIQITLAGLASLASYWCFQQLPNHGDGSLLEADPANDPESGPGWPSLTPLRDRLFRRYLLCFFVFAFANLFHSGILPAFFAKDLGLGYLSATVLMHIIPNVTAFLAGGRMTAWFDRTPVWRSYSFVTLMWGLDPVLMATLPHFWPAVIAARILRGPAIIGSFVLTFFTGVHSFAHPGRNTSRYMAALFLVNGFARFLAPTAAAFLLAYISRRSILFYGGLGVLASSALYLWNDKTAPLQDQEAS